MPEGQFFEPRGTEQGMGDERPQSARVMSDRDAVRGEAGSNEQTEQEAG